MASFTGKYGSVQRVLPNKVKVGSLSLVSAITSATELSIWDGMSVKDFGDTITFVPPQGDMGNANIRWGIRARPTLDGYQKPGLSSAVHPPTHPLAGQAVDDYSDTVSTVQDWSLDNSVDTNSFVASNTGSYNAKSPGKRSATGKFSGIGAFPPLNPGNRFLFRGFIGPESRSYKKIKSGVAGKYEFDCNGFVYQIAAVVTSIGININYGTFAPIQWTVNWASDWQEPGDQLLAFGVPNDKWGTPPTADSFRGFYDMTNPPCGEDIPSSTCTLRMGKTRTLALAGTADQICLESINMTFNTATNPVTNSCSAKSGGWQTSTAGSTDVQVQTQVHGHHFDIFNKVAPADMYNIAKRSKAHNPGIDRYVRIYVGSDTECIKNGAWEFNKMFLGSYTGMNVDIQGGGLISFGTQMEFNAFPRDEESQTCESGYIRYRLPDPDRSGSDASSTEGWNTFLDLSNPPANPRL